MCVQSLYQWWQLHCKKKNSHLTCYNILVTLQDQIDDYECLCGEGYFGRRCENAVDLCLPKPCQNGAHCTNLITDYNCTCLKGFDVRLECQIMPSQYIMILLLHLYAGQEL